jgi:hypothetical protein
MFPVSVSVRPYRKWKQEAGSVGQRGQRFGGPPPSGPACIQDRKTARGHQGRFAPLRGGVPPSLTATRRLASGKAGRDGGMVPSIEHRDARKGATRFQLSLGSGDAQRLSRYPSADLVTRPLAMSLAKISVTWLARTCAAWRSCLCEQGVVASARTCSMRCWEEGWLAV